MSLNVRLEQERRDKQKKLTVRKARDVAAPPPHEALGQPSGQERNEAWRPGQREEEPGHEWYPQSPPEVEEEYVHVRRGFVFPFSFDE